MIMEYALAFGFIVYIFFSYNEITKLKKQVKAQEKQLNECCKRTGNQELCSYFVSDEIKEKVLHLKNIGKLTEAVKEIRLETSMDLLEAKEYVDKL